MTTTTRESLRSSALSLTVGLFGALLLAFPDQMQEALRIMVESPPRAVAFLATALIASLTAWYWARVLTYKRVANAEQLLHHDRGVFTAVGFLPRLAGTIPMLGAAIALLVAVGIANGWTLIALALSAALPLSYIARRALLRTRARSAEAAAAGPPLQPLSRGAVVTLIVAFTLGLAVLIAASVAPVTMGTLPGMSAPAVIEIAIAAIIATWSCLLYEDRARRQRIVPILLVIAFVSTARGWNDNHEVRAAPAPSASASVPLRIDTAFERWLHERRDRDTVADYPVFVVAAEGGGIRAAHVAAEILGTIQDHCPAFARHLFAISGVSGGSVGAATFAGLARNFARNDTVSRCTGSPARGPELFRVGADRVLGADLLTPVVAKLLFPEMLQRFLPFPVPAFDRSRALEDGLARSWRNANPTGWSFDESFDELWGGQFEKLAVPALFLNSTQVETGERMVMSNLKHDTAFSRQLVTLGDLDPSVHLAMKTAAMLSARFTYVTPEGRIRLWRGTPKEQFRRYVDGGYFENSGVETAEDIVNILRTVAERRHERITPVVLRIGYFAEADTARTLAHVRGLSDATSPVVTVLNARSARGPDAVNRLWTHVAEHAEDPIHVGLIDLTLTQGAVPLILGWQLSRAARRDIMERTQAVPCDSSWYTPGTLPTAAEPSNALALRTGYCQVFELLNSARRR
jgi:hypothetical protein